MDWGKAKSVLIIAFLLLNMLLGYQLWVDIREQLNANVSYAELPQDKVQLMSQKQIKLDANLPLETPELRDLTYLLQSDSRDKADPIELETPVDSAIVFIKSELVDKLGGQIPDLEHYSLDLIASQDGVFVLYRIIEGRPMFDIKLELYYSNQKITAFRLDRVELLGTGEPKQVLPAVKVVASMIENYLPIGSVIVDIKLGYHGQIFDSEEQVSAPSWRIMLEDGRTYYVHAISGEVAMDGEQEEVEEEVVGE